MQVFPKGKNKACVHIQGGFSDTTKNILNILEKKPDNSLGVILGVAKEQPADWGTKKEHINSAGYPKAWGASDSHIDYLNVFVVEGDPENMDLATQRDLLKKAGLPDYSFSVDSGNRSLHAYYIADKTPPDKWKNIQERLIQLLQDKVPELKVDGSIKNPARVMRCVGGRHSKTNKFCEFLNLMMLVTVGKSSTSYSHHYGKRKIILLIRRRKILYLILQEKIIRAIRVGWID